MRNSNNEIMWFGAVFTVVSMVLTMAFYLGLFAGACLFVKHFFL